MIVWVVQRRQSFRNHHQGKWCLCSLWTEIRWMLLYGMLHTQTSESDEKFVIKNQLWLFVFIIFPSWNFIKGRCKVAQQFVESFSFSPHQVGLRVPMNLLWIFEIYFSYWVRKNISMRTTFVDVNIQKHFSSSPKAAIIIMNDAKRDGMLKWISN